jgi:phage shock protein C
VTETPPPEPQQAPPPPETQEAQEAQEAPPPAEPRPVLRRSRDDRVIGGVCGGLGRYFGIDPVILRIAFVLLLLAGGAGLLLYVIAWIAIPEEGPGDALAERAGGDVLGRGGGPELVGIALVVVGVFFLVREAFPDVFDSDYIWPILLIVLGLVVLARGIRR